MKRKPAKQRKPKKPLSIQAKWDKEISERSGLKFVNGIYTV